MNKRVIKKITKASSTGHYQKNIEFFKMLHENISNIEITYIKSGDIYFDLIKIENEDGEKNIIPVPIIMEVLFNKFYHFQIVPPEKELRKIYKVYYKILTSCHSVANKYEM